MQRVKAPPAAQTAQFLGQVGLFKALRNDHLRHLADHMELVTFTRDETVAKPGTLAPAIFVVRTGSIGVYNVENVDGGRFEAARLNTGDTLGEASAINNEKLPFAYRALDRTACLILDRHKVREILSREAEITLGLLQYMTGRLTEQQRRRAAVVGELSKNIGLGLDSRVPRHVLEKHGMIPISKKGGVLTVACEDVTNYAGLDELRRLIPDVEIHPVQVQPDELSALIIRYASQFARSDVAKAKHEKIDSLTWLVHEGEEKGAHLGPGGDDVKNEVDAILIEAIERGASDVHIEPNAEGVEVRYRLSGQLVKKSGETIPRSWARALVSRIKVLAELDISERRRPQDGRVSLTASGRHLDIRISTMPTHEGEKVVMRLLDSANAMQPLEQLILAEKVCRVVHKMVTRPHGVIYVCGPTGSGKTTTLYSAIGVVRGVHNNITTVEDPIEYNIPGITQVNVKPEIDLTFARMLRSILRQDPNVILVGETRDTETARLVVEAGLTGHLVLTSLHTNDALGTIQRLREMDIENFGIASSLIGIVSQRLIRRLCPACARDAALSEMLMEQLFQTEVLPRGWEGTLKGPKGCPACDNTGFSGRIGAYEILVADDEIRQHIMLNASQFELRATARKGAYVPLPSYGNFLLSQGMTSAEEVIGICAGR